MTRPAVLSTLRVLPWCAAAVPVAATLARHGALAADAASLLLSAQVTLAALCVYALTCRRLPLASPYWWIVASLVAASCLDSVAYVLGAVSPVGWVHSLAYVPPTLLMLGAGLRLWWPHRVNMHVGQAIDTALVVAAYCVLAIVGVIGSGVLGFTEATMSFAGLALLNVPLLGVGTLLALGPLAERTPRAAGWAMIMVPLADLARLYMSAGSTQLAGALATLWFYSFVLVALIALTGNVHPTRYACHAPERPSLTHLLVVGTLASVPPLLIVSLAVAGIAIPQALLVVSGAGLTLAVAARMVLLFNNAAAQHALWTYYAGHDALTGVASRHTWDAALAAAARTNDTDGIPRYIAVLDLDDFKWHNDTRGHLASDKILRELGAEWDARAEPGDILARYGGEEFTLLIHASTRSEAIRRVEALRRHVPGGQTCSAGLARWWPHIDSDEVFRDADAALYRAKMAGKNRLRVAPDRELNTYLPAVHTPGPTLR